MRVFPWFWRALACWQRQTPGTFPGFCGLGDGPMRLKIATVLLASCAAVMAQSAGAADLPVKAPVLKAAPYAAWNWTGLYVGGYVGVGVSRSRGHDPDNVPTGDIEH